MLSFFSSQARHWSGLAFSLAIGAFAVVQVRKELPDFIFLFAISVIGSALVHVVSRICWYSGLTNHLMICPEERVAITQAANPSRPKIHAVEQAAAAHFRRTRKGAVTWAWRETWPWTPILLTMVLFYSFLGVRTFPLILWVWCGVFAILHVIFILVLLYLRYNRLDHSLGQTKW